MEITTMSATDIEKLVQNVVFKTIQSLSTPKDTDQRPAAPITVNEAAGYLGISLPTIYTLIRTNQLQSFRIGRHIRIRPCDLEAYVNQKGFKHAA